LLSPSFRRTSSSALYLEIAVLVDEAELPVGRAAASSRRAPPIK
jgi:hypothetical protein